MNTKSISLPLLYGWLIIFAMLPMCFVFVASFLSRDSSHLLMLPLTTKHYQHLFSPVFFNIFIRTLILAGSCTIICLIIAYPFSYLMLGMKHQSVMLLLVIIPFWTSSLVRTYSLIALLKTHGLINQLLMSFGFILKPMPILFSNTAVMIGLVYNLLPFMIIPVFSSMQRFDKRLLEAGRDLGADGLALFFRIFLPATLGGIIAGCILVLLPAMTLFYIPNILGGARSMLLGNMIQEQFLVIENWPQGAATSVLFSALLLLMLLIFRGRRNEVLQ